MLKPATSHRKRQIYFWIFSVLFVVLIPVVTALALGYRLNDEWKIVATGGISLRNFPPDAEIYVNYSLESSRAFSRRSFFVENLVPGTYFVVGAKDGYWSWAKRMIVKEKQVSGGSVLMLPKHPKLRPIEEFTAADKEGLFSFFDDAATSSLSASTTLSLSREYQEIKELFDAKPVVGAKNFPIAKGKLAIWQQGSGNAQLYAEWLGAESEVPPFLCAGAPCQDAQLFYTWKKPVGRMDFMPNRNDAVLLATEEGLFAIEIDRMPEQNVQPVYLAKDLDFRVSEDESLYIKIGKSFFELEF